jgi:hypothetical protein
MLYRNWKGQYIEAMTIRHDYASEHDSSGDNDIPVFDDTDTHVYTIQADPLVPSNNHHHSPPVSGSSYSYNHLRVKGVVSTQF